MSKKVLIAYYSRSGVTKKVVEAISVMMDCDIEEIRDNVKRSGIFGFMRSGREAMKKTIIEIKDSGKDPSDYDVVILATPIWAGAMSSPIRSYLNKYKGKFKNVGFLVTQGGSGEVKAFEEVKDLAGNAPIVTSVITGKDMKESLYIEKLQGFVDKIKG